MINRIKVSTIVPCSKKEKEVQTNKETTIRCPRMQERNAIQ